MNKIVNIWPKKYSTHIILLSTMTMIINYIIFQGNSVNIAFLFFNLLVIVAFLKFSALTFSKTINNTSHRFEKNIFIIGFIIRVIVIIFLYYYFYWITNTEFDVAAVDSLWYHRNGIGMAKQILAGKIDLKYLGLAKYHSDDLGYIAFLGSIYSMFGSNVIVSRVIEAIFGSFSGVLVYRIGKSVYNENVGRIAAVFFIFFPSFLLYNALHLKETMMIYLLLMSIYYITINKKKHSIKNIVIIIGLIIATFFFRAVLSFLLLLTFLVSLFYSQNINALKKTVVASFSLLLLFILISQFNIVKEYIEMAAAYYDRINSQLMIVFRDRFVHSGQKAAAFASFPILLVQSVFLPYPSMVRTNIRFFDQAAQWYHIGSMFIWVFLSYWGLLGIYNSFKTNFKQNAHLLFFVLGYCMILIVTMYVTAIRMNLLKIAPMFVFIALGIVNKSPNRIFGWKIYLIFMCIVILGYNYLKLSGRGLL